MTREVEFKYVVVRDGADYTTLLPTASGSQQIRMDDTANIKMSFSGAFLDPGDSVNWLTDEIRPEIIVDGVAHSLGVYLPATVQETESETSRNILVEAYDRCWRVMDTYTEAQMTIPAGTGYILAIEQLLTTCGISLISATQNSAVLTEDRADWALGTSYLDIVNQLLSEINYNPLWFDAQGMAILEPASDPTAANIEHTLDDTNVKSLMLPGISKETDIYSAPNVIICICSNADKSGPMVATSENTNPQSPLSIPRRKRRIARVVQVSNIASMQELQAYADRLRNETMITGETIQVQTLLLPGFGVDDVTSIRYGDLFAVCIERSFTMDLRVGGLMSHTLEKVVINLG